jgi:hypothetical protein
MRYEMDTLADGTRLYSYDELKSMLAETKARRKERLLARDAVLILLYAHKEKPIYGRTALIKQLFLFFEEVVKKREIDAQEPRFVPYRFGPYSFVMMNTVDSLWHSGYIAIEGKKNSKKERFLLTEGGEKMASELFRHLPDEVQRDIQEKRKSWDQWGGDILQYVYTCYPRYKERSELKKKYGTIVWGQGKA